MTWKPELEEIARRTELAKQMGAQERVARARGAGRLPVRERIDLLLDAGSFHETGALAGKAEYDAQGRMTSFTPSNFVTGRGRMDGRPVVVGGDDFTVRGGAADGAVGNKMGWSEKTARELRIPIVRLVDGTGGGGSVKTNATIKRSYVPANPDFDVLVDRSRPPGATEAELASATISRCSPVTARRSRENGTAQTPAALPTRSKRIQPSGS